MFEAYTYKALMEEVLANAPEDIDTRQGSVFYDAVSGIVMQIAKMYTDLEQVFDYVFVSSASGKYLDLRADEYGMKRLDATYTKYILAYTGAAPPTGARFFHSDTGRYFTAASADDRVLLVAEEAGEGSGDIPKGDLAVPVNTISGMTSANFGDVYEYGTNRESDDALRARIKEKIAGPAENGNRQHYKTWCESIDGVGKARIFPLWNGPNTVKAILISPLGLPCSDNIVQEAQNYIDPADKQITTTVNGKTYIVGDGLGEGVANLGAHFTAAAAESTSIFVEFNAVIASDKTARDIEEAAAEAITEHFKDLVLNTEDSNDIVVRITSVGAIVSSIEGLIDYSNLTLNGGTSNITPGDDSVPALSGVTVNVGI